MDAVSYTHLPNLVRKAPVAVVDLSHSALSREYIRLLDATPQTEVSPRATRASKSAGR